jgi:uncharacterized membrane protein YidH (DUF202 family)
MKKHLWKRTSTYAILIAVCIGIMLLEFLVVTFLDKMGQGENINDNITEGVLFFICIPGILIGIIGAIISAVRKK